MKKVLIGVGIGCGVLIVLGGIAMVGGAWFVGHKVASVAQSAEKATQQMQAQQKQMEELDRKYPFTEPAQGQPLALTDDRLQAYLAIREAALPIFENFKKQSSEFDAKHKNAGQMVALSAASEAVGMFGELRAKLAESYAENLEKQKMGPAEFGAITGAIYSAGMGAAMAAQHDNIKKQVAEIDKQIAQATDPQVKAALEQSKATLEQMAGNAPDPKVAATFAANAKLTEKYKDRIEKAVNPAFDMFVMNGDSFEKQLQVGAGQRAGAAE